MKRILLIAGMCGLIVGCSKPLTNDQIILESNKCIQNGFAARNYLQWGRTVAVECEMSPFANYLRQRYQK